MSSVLFTGGPCNGRIEQLSDDQITAGHTECGGVTYTLERTGPNTVYAVSPLPGDDDTSGVGSGAGPARSSILQTSTALEGWNAVTHAMGVTLPNGLRSCDRARQTIRRH